MMTYWGEYLSNLVGRERGMSRGGTQTWWSHVPPWPSDEMTYECDAELLGSPSLVDCSQIQWQGLGPSEENVILEPESTKFFSHSKVLDPPLNKHKVNKASTDSCALALSASMALTLPWSRLQTAFDTLMNVCVENPTHPPQGGRAFFGAPSLKSLKWGKNRRRRRDTAVTGLDALPPNVNVTLFGMQAGSTLQCVWQAVQYGRSDGLHCGS